MQILDATSASPSQDSALPQGFRLPSQLVLSLQRWWYAHRLGRLESRIAALETDLKRLIDAGLKYRAQDRLKQNQYLYEERACTIVRLRALTRQVAAR